MENLCFNWHLASWVCLQFISLIFTPGPFLRQAVLTAPLLPAPLLIGGASKCLWSSCSYKKCHKVAALLMTTLVPGANSIRESRLPGLWNESGMYLREHLSACVSLLIPHKATHTHTHTHTHGFQTNSDGSHSTLLTVLQCLEVCTLRMEAWAGNPRTRRHGG